MTINVERVGVVSRRRLSKVRGPYAVAIAIAIVGLLTACGANIGTTMNVEATGSGARVMALTVSGQDVARLNGGTAAADASIRKRLPQAVTYSGLQPTSDGGETATFTVSFASTDAYKKIVSDLLIAGGGAPSDVDFSVSNSTLVQGMTLNENFTSYDLLKWMFDGLVTDGIVSAGNSSNMYSIGSNVVNYGGISKAQGGAFNFTSVQNNGFDTVTMQTTIVDTRHIKRVIVYTASSDHAAANKDIYAKFFAESTPNGAQLEGPSAGTWTMTFSGTPAVIAASTSKALGGSPSTFTLRLSDMPGDPSERNLDVIDNASGDAVCAESTPITDKVTTGTGYSPKSAAIDTTVNTATAFTYAPPITSVSLTFQFNPDGGVTGTVKFAVPKSSVSAVGDGFAKRWKPAAGDGTIKTTVDGSVTTYTVTISGKTPSRFASAFKKWAPGSSVTVSDVAGSGPFTQDAEYDITPALAGLTGSHTITGGTTSDVVLPFGQWVTASDTGLKQQAGITGTTVSTRGASTTIHLRTSGPTIGGLLLAGGILVILAIAVFFLVRHRRPVLAQLNTARARLGGAIAVQRLSLLERTVAPQTTSPHLPTWSAFDVPQPAREHATRTSLHDLAQPGHTRAPESAGSLLDIPSHPGTPPRPGSLFNITTTVSPKPVPPRTTLLT